MKTFFLTLIGALFSVLAYAQLWTVEKDGITYASDDGRTSYVSLSDRSITEANILPEINGCKVTKLITSSFYGHDKLRTVIIPNTIDTIDDSAFWGCNQLQEIMIPENVSYLDDFTECASLEVISVSPGNPYFCSINGVLYNSDRTTLIRCPEGKKGYLEIPEGIEEIRKYAFFQTLLDSVRLPSTLLTIPPLCFCWNRNTFHRMKTVIFPDNCKIKEFSPLAFAGCRIDSISLPPSLQSISVECFSYSYIKKVIFPENCQIKEIGDSAFFQATRLETIHIPNSVEKIGARCFMHCVNLSVVWLPEKVQLNDKYEFKNCRWLRELHLQNKVPPTDVSTVFGYEHLSEWPFSDTLYQQLFHLRRFLFVPPGTRELYETVPKWDMISEGWTYKFTILEEGEDKNLDINAIDANLPQDGPSYDLMGRIVMSNPSNNIIFRNGQKVLFLDR